jgi:hypothetical protein
MHSQAMQQGQHRLQLHALLAALLLSRVVETGSEATALLLWALLLGPAGLAGVAGVAGQPQVWHGWA